ncbi:hypothetical protein GR927_02920 [Mycolicibacterium sp. 3033]|nr:hypothetical protein [Mycolicibacterium aurantiacum]
MDSFDRQLVSFVLTWAPFGGPDDEDAFPRFGLRTAAVWQRFERILDAVAAGQLRLDDSDAELIRRAGELRLAPPAA